MKNFKDLNEGNLDDFLKNFNFETLNLADEEGNTYLHKLVEAKNIYGVEVFADLGANLNAKNKKGDTPTHIAVEINDSEIFETLINYGADLKVRNNSQRTPEQIAGMNNRREILQIITNCNGDYGYTEKIKSHRKLEE